MDDTYWFTPAIDALEAARDELREDAIGGVKKTTKYNIYATINAIVGITQAIEVLKGLKNGH